MRIVLTGAGTLATALLEGLLLDGHEVVGVAAPAGDPLLDAADSRGIAVYETGARLLPDTIPSGVDLIVSAGGRAYLPGDTRARARMGAIGYHPSLLPLHRGRDAIKWVIHLGEEVTGGTVYWMDDGVDSGPMAAQAWCRVRPDDDALSLWLRELRPLGAILLRQVVNEIEQGVAAKIEQDEALATWEPPFAQAVLASQSAR